MGRRISLKTSLLVFVVAALTRQCFAIDPLPRVPPREPTETLSTFEIEPGFSMELLAAEPMVVDPVAMVYDEQGRAFVAEMRDYPFVDKVNDKPFAENTADVPLGQIRLLEDLDEDGKFDKSTVFADKLSWPTGLACWKGGIYVAATPDLWYLKDTDGDGRADLRRKVFSGFRKFNVQTVINNLKWGFDNKLYGAGSSNGGQIFSGDDAKKPIVLMGTGDFRFDPRDEENSFELLTGGARFGLDFDDQGNRFICNIRNPIQHAVIERRYLARNAYVPSVSPLLDVAVSGDVVPVFRKSPPEPWRVLNAERLANDTAVASPRSEAAATGYMTSACGLTIYQGDAYPQEYYGTVFLGEVAGNLIHHQRMTQSAAYGLTFTSKRSHPNREFLTSTDNWFRPVNFVNAPDGSLHVLDMYRETIEHPWSIPDDIKNRLDLRSGSDRGRIYRLSHTNFGAPNKLPNQFRARGRLVRPQLATANSEELISYLSHQSVWWRETAHRLLLERQDPTAVKTLQETAVASQRGSGGMRPIGPDQRFHEEAESRALWILESMNRLDDATLHLGLNSSYSVPRKHAWVIWERRLANAAFVSKVIAEQSTLWNSPQDSGNRPIVPSQDVVKFQTALSLGAVTHTPDLLRLHGPTVAEILSNIARTRSSSPADNALIRTAVLSSAVPVAPKLFAELATFEFTTLPDWQVWYYDLAIIIGSTGVREDHTVFLQAMDSFAKSCAAHPAIRQDGLNRMTLGFAEGLARSKKNVQELLLSFDAVQIQPIRDAIDRAAANALNESLDTATRESAIGLLGFSSIDVVKRACEQLLSPGQSQNLQSSAVRTLVSHSDSEVPTILLKSIRQLTSTARGEVIEALLSRRQWHPQLLDALEQNVVRVGEIPYLRRNLLLRSTAPAVRDRAIKLMQTALTSRQDVVRRYQAVLEKSQGLASAGQAIFKRECQTCHRLEGEGTDIGPNLTTIRNRTQPEILLHILDPNREIAPNYVAYNLLLNDGRVLSGIVVEDGASSISLRTAAGTLETIPRANIEQIASSGQSLMPVGLEERISPKEMTDLLNFLLHR